jgi:DNA-directed RNA polymerase alpha subunit
MLSIRNFGEKSLDELILQLQIKGFWTDTAEEEEEVVESV